MSRLRMQNGGASLVAVALLSLFILAITIAMSRMMVGELRNAIDLESNVSAYYEAESGVEEAVFALKQAVSGLGYDVLKDANQGCDTDDVDNNFGAGGLSIPDRATITCRAIKLRGNEAVADLTQGGVAHFDLSKVGFTTMELSWDINTTAGGTFTTLGTNSPAVMEVTRINYKNTAAFGDPTQIDTNSIQIKSLLLKPDQPTALLDCPAPTNFSTCNEDLGGDVSNDGGPVTVRCSEGQARRCTAIITNFIPTLVPPLERPDTNRTVLRLRTYFNSSNYRLVLKDSSDKAVTIVLDKALVDVTARIGDSYRRIQQQIELVSKPYNRIDVLFGDENICKQFNVLNDGSTKEIDLDSIGAQCPISP